MTLIRAFRLKIRLKIPGVATHERGQKELAPNRSGGRAARDDLVPGYTAGVSPALLSTASSLAAAILHHGLGSQRAVRRETPVSPACSPPKRRGDSHPSGKRTWISFTCGFEAPKRHDLVSLAPPTSMPQLSSIFIRFHVGHRHRASPLFPLPDVGQVVHPASSCDRWRERDAGYQHSVYEMHAGPTAEHGISGLTSRHPEMIFSTSVN